MGAGLAGTAPPPWRLQQEHLGRWVWRGPTRAPSFTVREMRRGCKSPLPTSPAGRPGARRPAPKSSLSQSVGWVTSLQGLSFLFRKQRVGVSFFSSRLLIRKQKRKMEKPHYRQISTFPSLPSARWPWPGALPCPQPGPLSTKLR